MPRAPDSRVGRPTELGLQRNGLDEGTGQCRPRGIVRVVGVGEQQGVPFVAECERQLDVRRFRPRDQGNLGVGIERDTVDVAITRCDRLARPGDPADRCVAVHAGVEGCRAKRLDDVRRRAGLGVAAPEVEDRRPAVSRGRRDARQQVHEVLLRKALEALRAAHPPDGISRTSIRAEHPPRGRRRRYAFRPMVTDDPAP